MLQFRKQRRTGSAALRSTPRGASHRLVAAAIVFLLTAGLAAAIIGRWEAVPTLLLSALSAYSAQLLTESKVHRRRLEALVAQRTAELEQLLLQLRLTETVVEKCRTSIFWHDAEGKVLRVNEQACRSLGYSHDELIGLHPWDFDPNFPPEAWPPFWATLKAQGNHRLESHHRRKDGTTFPVEVIANYVTLGAVEVDFVFVNDITVRKAAEETLQQKERYQRALLDNFPFLVWLKDTESRFLAVNAPFARACGFDSVAALVGLNDLDTWPADLAEAYRADDRSVVAGGQPLQVEEQIQPAGQARRWFETYKSPVTLEGRTIGTVGFARDITKRKEAERLLSLQHDLLIALNETDSPNTAMQAILDAALYFPGVDCGGVYDVHPNDGSLTLRVHHGFSAAYVTATQTRAGDSPAAQAVRTGQARYSFINPLYPKPPSYAQNEGLRAYALIPILHHGRAVACLRLASHRVETMPPNTCRALETLALQLGGVLARLKTQTELEEQRINLSAVFGTLEDFLFILDEHGRILQVNPAVERRLGYSQQELIGRPVLAVHPPDRHEDAAHIVAAILANQADSCTVPLLTRSGDLIPVETRVVAGRWSDRPALIGLSRDVTVRKAAEDALRASEERLQRVLEGSNDGFWDWNIVTGEVSFSRRWAEMLGYSPEDIVPHIRSWEERVHPDDLPACRAALQAHFNGKTAQYETEHRMCAKNGEWRWVLNRGKVTVRDAAEHPLRMSGIHTDITDRKRMQDALREQATHDPLTGLFNRRYLDETLPRELQRRRRSGKPLAVAMLDLDHFKRFNDAYGHEAGDIVLRSVGDLLRRSLRAGDVPCRYGGEELTVVMPGLALDDARARLNALRQAVMQLHLTHQGSELPVVTVSIGVATAKPDETDAGALLNRADAALYRAKERGRNRVVVAGDV